MSDYERTGEFLKSPSLQGPVIEHVAQSRSSEKGDIINRLKEIDGEYLLEGIRKTAPPQADLIIETLQHSIDDSKAMEPWWSISAWRQRRRAQKVIRKLVPEMLQMLYADDIDPNTVNKGFIKILRGTTEQRISEQSTAPEQPSELPPSLEQ